MRSRSRPSAFCSFCGSRIDPEGDCRYGAGSKGPGLLADRDPEILSLDLAVAERQPRGPVAMLFEERGLEPLALRRRVDGDDVVAPGWQSADSGTSRSDPAAPS